MKHALKCITASLWNLKHISVKSKIRSVEETFLQNENTMSNPGIIINEWNWIKRQQPFKSWIK